MTEIPAENYSPSWADDSRTALPLVGDEREILTAYLDWHRETFALKCAGDPTDISAGTGLEQRLIRGG